MSDKAMGMDLNQMYIPREIAREFVQMWRICWDEGLGTDTENGLIWIRENYPDLQTESDFKYLPWGSLGEYS
jgi:hypothetical protein